MTTLNIDNAAFAIAQELHKGGSGATQSIVSGVRPPTSGYMVSLAGAELQLPYTPRPEHNGLAWRNSRYFEIINYAEAHRDDLARPGHYLGAWVDGDTLYLDVSEHFAERQPAILAGFWRHQLAIFDLAAGESIPTIRDASADYGYPLAAGTIVAPATDDDADLTALLDSLSWEERAAADSGKPITWQRAQENIANGIPPLGH